MPLEELLALYNYVGQQEREPDEVSEEQTSEVADEETSTIDEDSKPAPEASTLHELYDKIPETDQDPDGSRLLRC